MRIFYLADIRFPLERANGIQTAETCHALAQRGHIVTLFVRPDTHRPPRDPLLFYGLEHDRRLRIRRALAPGPPDVRRAAYLAQALARTAGSSRRYDIVMTRDLGVASVLLALPRALRPPVVFESHGFAPVFAETLHELVAGAKAANTSKQQRLFRREQRVWHRSDGYVATTRVLATELVERFGSRSAVATIPNGTRLVETRGAPLPVDESAPVVTYAGHLYPWKGVDVLVRALAQLPGVRGVIVGGHPRERDLDRVKDLARELGIGDRIAFVGSTDSAGVRTYLQNATVLALPTVDTSSARYTSPLKLFEYMAAGRPIVASDLPSIREIVQEAASASLVPPNDPHALASAIRRLLDDRPMADRLAQSARARVADYSWARRAERLERLFDEVRRS